MGAPHSQRRVASGRGPRDLCWGSLVLPLPVRGRKVGPKEHPSPTLPGKWSLELGHLSIGGWALAPATFLLCLADSPGVARVP